MNSSRFIGALQLHHNHNHITDSNPLNISENSLRIRKCKLSVACDCAALQASIVDPIASISHLNYGYTEKPSIETALILIRHGESMWNEKNLFTGSVDVPLTSRGVDEAIEAGKRISNIPIDLIYTSALIRAQMTAMLALTQHCCKKVPIITHNYSKQAEAWSRVHSDETKKQSIPVITAWQLNERMYGELQGLNKQETAERYGKERVHEWRRSYDIRPPEGESLQMCSQRAVAYFREHIEPQLQSGKHVMVAAHANSLRSIIMYLEKLTSCQVETISKHTLSMFFPTLSLYSSNLAMDERLFFGRQISSLELSTGVPLLYIYNDGMFMKRGSPVGPSEAGVYAYTSIQSKIIAVILVLCGRKRGRKVPSIILIMATIVHLFVFIQVSTLQAKAGRNVTLSSLKSRRRNLHLLE